MKGDFTRSTFRPEKQYTTVRMQQGRLQLDSDWNEQVDIFNYLNQTQLQDLIGVSGIVLPKEHTGSELPNDCKVTVPQGGQDLVINPGRIYVDGILCDVKSVNPDSLSYTNQPYHPNALKADLGIDSLSKLDPGDYTVYLDIWERHITAIEDPEIRELALNGLDTTTRTKRVWQIKLVAASKWEDLVATQNRLSNLTAELKTSASENQLYRIEIHQPGAAGTATFKWSRDNGSMVSPVKTIKDNIITIDSVGRDTWQSFAAGQWIEITDEEREWNNQPGTMVQLLNVVSTSAEGSQLVFDPSTTEGVAVTADNFPNSPKVRRWDYDPIITDKAVRPTSTPSLLDKGIEVKFADGSSYQTGDYWLLPIRDNQLPENTEWSGKAQSAETIQHHYCPLAIVTFNGTGFVSKTDTRESFPSLSRCLDTQTGLGTLTQALGLGRRKPTAALDIQNITEPGQGTIKNTEEGIEAEHAEAFADWTPGYVIFSKDQLRSVSEVFSKQKLQTIPSFDPPLPAQTPFTFLKAVTNQDGELAGISTSSESDVILIPSKTDFSMLNKGDIIIAQSQARVIQELNPGGRFWSIRIDAPFESPLRNSPFAYQQPIARFADSSGKTQVIVDALGNMGVGTETPSALLDVGGKLKAETIEIPPTGSFEAGEFIGQRYTLQRVNNETKTPFGSIQTSENEGNRQIQFTAVNGANFAFLGGDVTTANLNVQGQATANTLRITESLQLRNGQEIIEFSTDRTFDNASDRVVPTQLAIKVYIDDQFDEKLREFNEALSRKANLNGSEQVNFSTRDLTIANGLRLRGSDLVTEFSTDGDIQDRTSVIPTERAVRAFVNNRVDVEFRQVNNRINELEETVNDKAERSGSLSQDFQVNNLTLQGTLTTSSIQIAPNVGLREITGERTGLLIDNDVRIARAGRPTADLTVEGVVEAEQFRGNRVNIGNAPNDPDVVFALQVNGDSQFTGEIRYNGTLLVASSRELKDEITDLSSQEVTELLQNLAPVKYVYKEDLKNRVHVGFISEDTPDLITSVDKKAVNTLEIVAILTKAVQDHRQIVRNLSSYVDAQQREIVLLQTKLSELESRSSQRSWFR